MASGNPQDKVFNFTWPNPVEFVVGTISWSPEECIVVTNYAVYRVQTPFDGPVNVIMIASRL